MGKISKELRLGETQVMNCGIEATIVAYENNTNVSVRFPDGTTKDGVIYQNFRLGKVSPKDHQRLHKKRAKHIRLGETKQMHCGLTGTIVAYRDSHDVDVKFPNGEVATQRTYRSFQLGSVLPPSYHM